jgi:AraC family transcriptional regulator, activator of mtrCDE
MDALSNVIALARIQGSLDLRCLLAGKFNVDIGQATQGYAPFHLVLTGSVDLKLPEGRTVKLVAGDFLLLPRGTAHILSGTGDGRITLATLDESGALPQRRNTDGPVELDLLCGRFSYEPGFADVIMSALPDVLHVSIAEAGSLNGLDGIVAMLRHEVAQLDAGALAIVTSLSQILFVLALRSHARGGGIPASLLAMLSDQRLSTAVLAMMKAPGRTWTVDTLAREANMSRATFARHFMEKSAMSPMDLLATLRMRLACDLLQSSDISIARVAERVGYQSESAFAKVFQKKVGLTPATYRKRREQP